MFVILISILLLYVCVLASILLYTYLYDYCDNRDTFFKFLMTEKSTNLAILSYFVFQEIPNKIL